MFKMRIVFFSVLMLLAQPCIAGLMHDSESNWVMAESDHFRIHYNVGETELAKEALRVAEVAYTDITAIFGWYPLEKTELVLSDEIDASNGFATPIPSNRINLFASSPALAPSLADYNGWLETLIRHEFVHIIHMDMAKGSARNLRDTFGRFPLLFPNVFTPPWMIEGLATYYETDKKQGIGRGQGSYFSMMMRMEVAEGIKPLRQINQPMVSWPLGTSRYLYGVWFFQFIAEDYGEETLQKLVSHYSSNLIPFRINTLYMEVLGKDLTELWQEFDAYLIEKFEPELRKVREQGIAQGRLLSATGDFKSSVIQTKAGQILYVEDHLSTGSHLVVQNPDESEAKRYEVNAGALADWHEDSGLLLAQPETCNNANSFYDLYRLDLATGEQTRLTHCARYIFAAWSGDGEHIMAVQNEGGQHAIHLLDAGGELEHVVWQGNAYETLASIDWATDASTVLSTVWREESGWNIEELNLKTGKWSKRTNDAWIESGSRYVGDSKDIVFSSDVRGIFNVFRLNEGESHPYRLTHVEGGVFSPFLTSDGKLLSIDYHAQGFDVAKLDSPLNVSSPGEKAEYVPAARLPDVSMTEPLPYEPWDTLKPTAWLPLLQWSNQGAEFGATISGSDVLYRHAYNLYAGYQSISATPVFALDYVYDRWLPLIRLHAEVLEEPSFDKNGGLIALVNAERLDAELVIPDISDAESWQTHVGVNMQTLDLSWLAAGYTTTFTGYQDAITGVSFVYDARDLHPRSISSASEGRLWSFALETGQGLGGDYQGNVTIIRGREFVDLFDEHVLAFRVDMGLGDSESRPFRLGGSRSDLLVTSALNAINVSTRLNRRNHALRGYGEGEAQLSGESMGLLSAEYRFPIARIERGLMTPPIGIHQVYGNIFVDSGRAWDTFDASKTYTGIGAEIGADLVLFYNAVLRMDLGVAKGLDEAIGGQQVYVRLGSSF